MEIYERMKQYIVDNHLKQSSIARDMGLLESTFSMMLNGKRHIMADDIEKFCKSVKQSPELFIEFDKEA